MKYAHYILLATSFITNKVQSADCPFGYGANNSTEQVLETQLEENLSQMEKEQKRNLQEDNLTPLSGFLNCPTRPALETVADFDVEAYESIVKAVIGFYENQDPLITPESNPRAEFAGCLVRLAGHDFLDFKRGADEESTSTGGSDGCINFAEPLNRGLVECVDKTQIQQIYQEYCPIVSLADFIVIAAEAVMGRTSTYADVENTFSDGTQAKQFRDQFKFGRKTPDTCFIEPSIDPEQGCQGLNRTLVQNIFDDRKDAWVLATAISGAHSLGKARTENSGYSGQWSTAGNEGVFNNDYFETIISKGWAGQANTVDGETKTQWKRVDVGASENPEQSMLPTDLCLAYETNKELQECYNEEGCDANSWNCPDCRYCPVKFAGEQDLTLSRGSCCAWNSRKGLGVHKTMRWTKKVDYCGAQNNLEEDNELETKVSQRAMCCANEPEDSFGDCDLALKPMGPGFDPMQDFTFLEKTWLRYFTFAWGIATTNGHDELTKLVPSDKRLNVQRYYCPKLTQGRLCRAAWQCEWKEIGKKTVTFQRTGKTYTFPVRGCRDLTRE